MTSGKLREDEIAAMEAHFHALVGRRLASMPGVDLPDALPVLDRERWHSEPRWFPVPGMYGGFSWTMRQEREGPVLIVESWSRVVEGSGQRHRITPAGCVLEAEGFV